MNVFFVMTPFQYICAEEAQRAYQTSNDILIVVAKDQGRSTTQLLSSINKERWKDIILFKGSKTLFFPSLINKLRAMNESNDFNNFFFAQFNSWNINVLRANLNFKHHVFFDDGTNTIYEYHKFIKEKVVYTRKKFWKDYLLKLQGHNPAHNLSFFSSFEIFTIFDISSEEINIKKNDLSTLKEKLSFQNYFSEAAPVGIIGQGAIGDKNYISIKDYVEIVSSIAREHDHIIYFPHRTESTAVKNEILKIKNIRFHESSSPLEREIAFQKIQLSEIYGIISTGFYTLKLLYPKIKINMIEIDSEKYYSESAIKIFKMIEEHAKNTIFK